MTKKDFELIAAAIVSTRIPYDRVSLSAYQLMLGAVAESLANALATTNPRFDRARFLAACGVAS